MWNGICNAFTGFPPTSDGDQNRPPLLVLLLSKILFLNRCIYKKLILYILQSIANWSDTSKYLRFICWVSDCCLAQSEYFSAISWREHSNIMARTQQYLGENTAISWRKHSNIMAKTQQYLGENTAISWREEVICGWDDDICFVLATPTHLPGVLYCYICSSLKQSAGRHVAPFGYIIPIPSQPVCALSPKFRVLSGKEANTNFTVLDLTPPLPTTLMTSTPLHQRCGRFICYIDYRDNTVSPRLDT